MEDKPAGLRDQAYSQTTRRFCVYCAEVSLSYVN